MKRAKLTLGMVCLVASCLISSCMNDDDENWILSHPTALVTVYTSENNAVQLQLDESTILTPTNITKPLFDGKEVRALVNYTVESQNGSNQNIHVNWIDSIRTKMPVICTSQKEADGYGEDPLEIIKDWVTVAEDGYLTLRIRTKWGNTGKKHILTLVSGLNPENPFELELHHDANGDTKGTTADALIAFNLNKLADTDLEEKTITLKWESFSGEKTAKFKLNMHSRTVITTHDTGRMMNIF